MSSLEVSNSNYENTETQSISRELDDLRKEIKKNYKLEDSVTKIPEIIGDKVVFDYESSGELWEIVCTKDLQPNTYNIKVKMRENNARYSQTIGNQKIFNITANDQLSFNRGLGNILDQIIGNNRDRLPKTGGYVYKLLNQTPNITRGGQHEDKGNSKEKQEYKGMPEGLKLDHGVYIYTIKKGDTLDGMKIKLQNYPPLSYLSGDGYGVSAGTGFNVSTVAVKYLRPGMEIPVPIEHTKRKKTVSEFKNSAKSALSEMKRNGIYKAKINDLIKTYGEKTITNMMVAYAKSESSPDSLDGMIGHFALYRWEQKHNCASYGYYHILKSGAGERAFKNLGMTVGQSFDPKNSGKLFLAYCCEYTNYKDFFDTNHFDKCARIYNGSGYKTNNYDTKLKNNYDYVKRVK